MKRAKGLCLYQKHLKKFPSVLFGEHLLYSQIVLLYKKGGTLHQVRLTSGQLIYLLNSGTNLTATCKHNIPSTLEE
jgi:hypothetical protein